MNYALITGMGRSGTTWLAHALNAATDLDVGHESREYVGEFCACPGTVEVNSYWRFKVEQFRLEHPRAVIIQLVRDGRDVVRSSWGRHPEWSFDEACQHWVRANELVGPFADATFRLEDLTAGKHMSRVLLCSHLGVDYVPGKWAPLLDQPKNASPRHNVSAYDDWPEERRERFWLLCGPTMAKLGYE